MPRRSSPRTLGRAALAEALRRSAPETAPDPRGYVARFTDTLVPMALPVDFEDDLRRGDGNELETKFRAAHSSSALVVNCFAPFRHRIDALSLPGADMRFTRLRFEAKCPTGLRRGRAPNLDVILDGETGVVAVESKLLEYLTPHRAAFAADYALLDGGRPDIAGYYAEMERLCRQPDAYRHLDAAQLVKHAFGLAHSFPGRPVTLLYLFWEPRNADAFPAFAQHRAEIARFAAHVAGSRPAFAAMTHADLWSAWRSRGPAWLQRHVDALEPRYLLTI